MRLRRRQFGLTLVELLVVITVIGVLVALLLPAVQAAREAARRVQCKNHLRQLAVAAMTHEAQIGHFPTGGWGPRWVGDADRGFTRQQPGSWAFSILPFLEESNLYDLAGDGLRDEVTEKQLQGVAQVIESPISLINCPSRRPAIAYPIAPQYLRRTAQNTRYPESGLVGKRDYAICVSDFVGLTATVPANYDVAYSFSWCLDRVGRMNFEPGGSGHCGDHRVSPLTGSPDVNGISFGGSEVGVRHVSDGTSNTYLIGEKYVMPEAYFEATDPETGERIDGGDSLASWLNGNNYRWGSPVPLRDTNGVEGDTFGSAHPAGFHMAFCDGSVRVINYDIELRVHQMGANRMDGLAFGD